MFLYLKRSGNTENYEHEPTTNHAAVSEWSLSFPMFYQWLRSPYHAPTYHSESYIEALHNFRKMPPISPSCHQILVDTSADKEELAKFCHGSFSSC